MPSNFFAIFSSSFHICYTLCSYCTSLLQYIVLPHNYSFCSFSYTLSSSSSPPPHLSQCVTILLLHPINLYQLISLQYKLKQSQPSATPDTSTLHYNRRTVPIHTKMSKPSSPHTSSITHLPSTFCHSLLCHLYKLPKFLSLAKQPLPKPDFHCL
jgi:hypothetical protein